MWPEHTHTDARKQLHSTARTQTKQSECRGEKVGVEGRYEWYYGRKIFICYKVLCGMGCCMMRNVCGLDGLQSVKWCRMVWRRAYGVKWWREIAAWCGMSWCDFKCFVVWIYKVMCSVQSSLLFVYYVVFSEMSVQYCLCVSTIQCTQCSLSVYRVGSVL